MAPLTGAKLVRARKAALAAEREAEGLLAIELARLDREAAAAERVIAVDAAPAGAAIVPMVAPGNDDALMHDITDGAAPPAPPVVPTTARRVVPFSIGPQLEILELLQRSLLYGDTEGAANLWRGVPGGRLLRVCRPQTLSDLKIFLAGADGGGHGCSIPVMLPCSFIPRSDGLTTNQADLHRDDDVPLDHLWFHVMVASFNSTSGNCSLRLVSTVDPHVPAPAADVDAVLASYNSADALGVTTIVGMDECGRCLVMVPGNSAVRQQMETGCVNCCPGLTFSAPVTSSTKSKFVSEGSRMEIQ